MSAIINDPPTSVREAWELAFYRAYAHLFDGMDVGSDAETFNNDTYKVIVFEDGDIIGKKNGKYAAKIKMDKGKVKDCTVYQDDGNLLVEVIKEFFEEMTITNEKEAWKLAFNVALSEVVEGEEIGVHTIDLNDHHYTVLVRRSGAEIAALVDFYTAAIVKLENGEIKETDVVMKVGESFVDVIREFLNYRNDNGG